jgi:hypothetical protein
MEAEAQWKQQWLAAVFLCGWFLFANGEPYRTARENGVAHDLAIVLQMFIAVINEVSFVCLSHRRRSSAIVGES